MLCVVSVQFKHDWRVVADSHRVKVVREDEDHWTLTISNAIHLDEGLKFLSNYPLVNCTSCRSVAGLYECVAENIAGKIYCTANVRITEKPHVYRNVSFTNVPVEDHFHVIDEIGRCVLQVHFCPIYM